MKAKFGELSFDLEILDQANNPPGNDLVLGSFYKTIYKKYQTDRSFRSLIKLVKKVRKKISNKHLINLLFRTYQYLKINEKDLSYKNYTQLEFWEKELEIFFQNSKNFQRYRDLVLTKSTTTTIYQRYMGPFSIIHHYFKSTPVTVLDIGCGGNYGLRGISLGEPFKSVSDSTDNNFIGFKPQEIKLKKAVAIDLLDPDDEEVTKWRLACSFYPQELDNFKDMIEFENRIRKAKKIKFIKDNFLYADDLGSFDVIIFCVMLYQYNESDHFKLIKKARELLKPNGLLIIQDFASKSRDEASKLDFKTSWFGEKFSHKTFLSASFTNWNFWEILKWDSGRCNEIHPGEDFHLFYQNTIKNSKEKR